MDFVKEGKLEEEIKRRQAEWERVRRKEDPIEAPPEVFDNRTLYDKLKEQNDIKKKEYEDQFAMKNQIRGIDIDEAEFLTEIDKARLNKEREIRLEEKREVEEVKKALHSKTPTADVPKISINLPSHKKDNKQADLLASVIVSKRKLSATTAASLKMKPGSSKVNISAMSEDFEETKAKKAKDYQKPTSSRLVVGILPGLGEYDSDSSSLSEDSSEEEEDGAPIDNKLDTNAIFNRKSEQSSAASQLAKF